PELPKAARDARATLSDVRQYMAALRQTEESGGLNLPVAVSRRVDDLRRQSGLHVDLEETGAQRDLEPYVERALIRIVGEALRNVAQHASARNAKVVLRYQEEQVVVTIEDDGKGFASNELDTAEERGHYGIVGMRERAAGVGGQLVVRSEGVGEAGDGHEALARAQELLPDVILMDIKMGDWDGVTATRRVRNSVPSSRVIVLTNYDEDDLVFSSIRAGASGYLLKEVTGSQLANAIRTVADGFSLIYPSVAKRVLDEFGRLRSGERPAGDDEGYSDLTAREREVLKLVASGRANKEIAASRGISERTVKAHISNIFSKLELTDRTQAA